MSRCCRRFTEPTLRIIMCHNNKRLFSCKIYQSSLSHILAKITMALSKIFFVLWEFSLECCRSLVLSEIHDSFYQIFDNYYRILLSVNQSPLYRISQCTINLTTRWSTVSQINKYIFYYYNIGISSLYFFFGVRVVFFSTWSSFYINGFSTENLICSNRKVVIDWAEWYFFEQQKILLPEAQINYSFDRLSFHFFLFQYLCTSNDWGILWGSLAHCTPRAIEKIFRKN